MDKRLTAGLGAAILALLTACGDGPEQSTGSTPDAPRMSEAAVPPPSAAPAAPAKAPPPPQWPYLDGTAEIVTDGLLDTNIYVLLDGSGSMNATGCSGGDRKITAAKQALKSFVGSVPENANLGFAAFDGSGIRERLPLGKNNRPMFVTQVDKVDPSGGTPLKSAIRLSYEKLTEQAKRQLGYGEYHLVVVTDGEANSGEIPTSVVNDMLKDSPVAVHTIGFCIAVNHSLNQPGRTDYRAAQDAASLSQALQAVLAEAPEFDAQSFQ